MSTQLKLRRGTTTQHSTFTGAAGEITVDTDKKTVVVHDGSTAGGNPLATAATPTFSGNVTLSSGTANGVAYLNGSKVLTTGSALTFDGTNLGIGGAAAPIAGYSVVSQNAATGSTLEQRISGTLSASLTTDSQVTLKSVANLPLVFGVNNSEQIRLTSTGLGIGTSSPGAKLHVYSSTNGSFTSPTAQVGTNTNSPNFTAQILAIYPNELDTDYLSAYNTGTGGNNNGANIVIANSGRNGTSGTVKFVLGLDAPGGAGITAAIGTASNHPLTFGTNSAEKMRLDSSGNLGLGVTPSPWASYQKAMDFGGAGNYGAISARSGLVELGNNCFYNDVGSSSDKYKNTAAASKYQLNSGFHAWYTAPSGTAGDAISFTQAMTLDASGNLGIGTSSPANKLTVNGDIGSNKFAFYNEGAGSAWSTSGYVRFVNGSTENMRIDSSGNVQVSNLAGTGNRAVYSTSTGILTNSSSDGSLKENDTPISQGLDAVLAMRPISYEWIDKEKMGAQREIGFIAQEMQQIVPEVVGSNSDETLSIDYPKLVAVMAKAIQEQQELINQLTARVAQLEGN